jgi:hypothetical protein
MSQTLILTRPRTSNSLRSVSTAKTEGLLRDIAFVLHISDRLAGEIRKSRPSTALRKPWPASDELVPASYN